MITKETLLNKNVVQLDNEYLDAYVDLINRNATTEQQKYKTQLHHIIPVYYFKHLGVPIDDSRENTVNLLYRDHILAHYYLFKCSDDKYKYSNSVVIALGRKNSPVPIKDFGYVLDDEVMSLIQEAYEYAIMVQSNPDSEAYQKRIAGLRTPEYREKHSEKIKLAYKEGRLIPNSHKSTEGKKHYTNGEINVYAFECPDGFTDGFTISDESRSNMGWSKGLTGDRFNTIGDKIRINNGLSHKYVSKDELQSYLDTGNWFEGSLDIDFGLWYTDGVNNTRIPEDKPVPEGYYRGYTGSINNITCTCIINNESLEFNSKKDLFNYLFTHCTNKKGRNKAGWKTVSGLSGYVYRCIGKGKPIELEIDGTLSKIEIV